MRIVFFGTPEFAANILSYLVEKKCDIISIVTQKDIVKGSKITQPFVKKKSLELFDNPLIFQPVKASDPLFIQEISKLKADLFIVVAYGQILKKELLGLPLKGCINVHASLLPKYRGAAPIQRAILNGEKKTGITIMKMAEKMDAGDIISAKEVDINDMNFGELEAKLCEIAKPLLLEVIESFEKNTVNFTAQNEKLVTFAPKISISDLEINFNNDAMKIYNQIRAFSPSPGARCNVSLNGEKKMMKILKCKVVNLEGDPFKILKFEKDLFIIGSNNGAIQILTLQIEGKKPMDVSEFIRGIKNGLEILS